MNLSKGLLQDLEKANLDIFSYMADIHHSLTLAPVYLHRALLATTLEGIHFHWLGESTMG